MPAVVTRLSSLKLRQLQKIALSTGILSSGTKKDLTNRLIETFQKYNPQPYEDDSISKRDLVASRLQERHAKPMSILSIDMGIRNLAYAHLLVSPRTATEASVRDLDGNVSMPLTASKIRLNAWDRLAISAFPRYDIEKDPATIPISKLGGLRRALPCPSNEEGNAEVESKEHFAPYLYASHAYTLITSLLETYKPTHVLIERQRFRSGGGSAVQEWTIRVGVFEGMLYAVLHTLQRQAKKEFGNVFVQGVDPQRVVRYWTNGEIKEDSTPEPKKKRVSSKEGKKAKIDLIGRCISRSISAADCYTNIDGGGVVERLKQEVSLDLDLVEDSHARDIVHAYLEKWNCGNRGSKKRPTSANSTADGNSNVADIGKLDDLADSLLQGITWLEWQRTTEKLLHSDSAIFASL
ncbi:uncharacterized protein GIQ15_01393 [Arthroderma uncinatum]|uniref:uncharacterized protein n=1 Tax=Arthroderma uncinatum TaxID=74035 RepID=UPI00144A9040|nr:uncharacterized protein GIQ15_01393 [Arthroderma uncinatum]KAF3491876.1 hypothetical protein GIQ15_01393 [Arthroderma uncinatum]